MNEPQDIAHLLNPYPRIALLYDPAVAAYALQLQRQWACKQWCALPVPGGESCKSMRWVRKIYAKWLTFQVDRSWLVLCLGGGSICDLGGFAASTYMRGLPVAMIPTTLLAMTDAALGGKNGINFKGYKNYIGCFRQPQFVYTQTDFLVTLPPQEWANGWAEMIKHGIIASAGHFRHLEKHLPVTNKVTEALVAESQAIKRRMVAADEQDHGIRRLLNLGHTFGQALEAYALGAGKPIAHGHAVGIGIDLACRLSVSCGLLTTVDYLRIRRLLQAYGLPLQPPFPMRAALSRLCKDKKREGDRLPFVLPTGIGSARLLSFPLAHIARRAWWGRFTTAGVTLGVGALSRLSFWIKTAPWVELRLDLMDEADTVNTKTIAKLRRTIAAHPGKILLTDARLQQGSARALSLLLALIPARPAWVDIPFAAPAPVRTALKRACTDHGAKCLGSVHYFETFPDKMRLMRQIRTMFAENHAVKIAVYTEDKAQAADFMEWRHALPDVRQVNTCFMVMGPHALVMRRQAEQEYMPFVFTAPAAGLETAPGQPLWYQVQDFVGRS